MITGRQAGASQLEVILVIALILVFITTLLREFQAFYEESEQVQVQVMLENLNISVNSLVTEHIVVDDLSKLVRYRGSNPMTLLASKGLNYVGEVSGSKLNLEPAKWYFNTTTQNLIYQLRDPFKVNQQEGTPGQLNFQLNLKYQDVNQNNRYDRGVDRVFGLALEPVYPYQWVKS
jgi:hypothetical protein